MIVQSISAKMKQKQMGQHTGAGSSSARVVFSKFMFPVPVHAVVDLVDNQGVEQLSYRANYFPSHMSFPTPDMRLSADGSPSGINLGEDSHDVDLCRWDVRRTPGKLARVEAAVSISHLPYVSLFNMLFLSQAHRAG
ncbi:hypothetical protein CLAIMM_08847 isoform 2 [Cladophialophora immunda]|nr:hypothetical protein CLAIMM_08847 isoform 1 [Cladophialophora immunda]OQV03861.1 hypothetical protein CLAIMM_08847 isoform 2 [Cladophialophora immunda]